MSQSKRQTAANPLGTRTNTSDGLGSYSAQIEPSISRRTPRAAMTSGVVQTPTGAIISPRRRSSSGRAPAHPWRIRVDKINGVYTAKITDKGTDIYNRGTLDKFAEVSNFSAVAGSEVKEWEGALASSGKNYIYLEATWADETATDPTTFTLQSSTTLPTMREAATGGSPVVEYLSAARSVIGIVEVDAEGKVLIDQHVLTTLQADNYIVGGYATILFVP